MPFYAFLNFCSLSWSLNKTSSGIDSLTVAKRSVHAGFFLASIALDKLLLEQRKCIKTALDFAKTIIFSELQNKFS